MELPHLNLRAIIFDVYGTLLAVGPATPDADTRWQHLCREMLRIEPPLSRLDFSVAASKVIGRHHEVARARGISWPEVHWPSVVTEILPELARLPRCDQEEFLFRQIQIGHTTHMTAETAATLSWLKDRPLMLGIASNAQAYTMRELQEALEIRGLGMELFKPELCFWSFEHGFSKPEPHVFQILTTHLAGLGISPCETLMVGDRMDNDIAPAEAHGWQTWQLATPGNEDMTALREALCEPASIAYGNLADTG
jgi:FMN phosphatase YigB (HAD superfamily)